MKKSHFKQKALYSLFALGLFSLAGVGTAFADIGSADGVGKEFGRHEGRRGMEMHQGIGDDIREGFREDMKANLENLTKEERQALREKHHTQMSERKEAFEEFTGLSRDDMHELKENGGTVGSVLLSNGKTQADAEAFLTTQANLRIDSMVELHSLSTEEENTLRSRVGEFVQNILERWFGSL